MNNPHPHPIPSSRHLPDPVHSQGLERLGNEITELCAHLDAGEFQFLHLIGIFDEEGGWEGPGIGSCVTWLNWKSAAMFPRKRPGGWPAMPRWFTGMKPPKATRYT